eukprot:360538-Chlamydomonas_euryale.AAC.5
MATRVARRGRRRLAAGGGGAGICSRAALQPRQPAAAAAAAAAAAERSSGGSSREQERTCDKTQCQIREANSAVPNRNANNSACSWNANAPLKSSSRSAAAASKASVHNSICPPDCSPGRCCHFPLLVGHQTGACFKALPCPVNVCSFDMPFAQHVLKNAY